MKPRGSEVSGQQLHAVPRVRLGFLGDNALSLFYIVLMCNEYSYLRNILRAVTARCWKGLKYRTCGKIYTVV